MGGIKAAAKRTVFADVSNTLRQPPAKDDMVISAKTNFDVLKDPAIVAVKELSKPTALLRPAQRPLSTVASRISLANIPNSVASAVPKHMTTESNVQTANIKKVLSRKNTTIFKEAEPEPIVESYTSTTSQPLRPVTSTTLVHQSLPSRRETGQSEAYLESSVEKSGPDAIIDSSKLYLPTDHHQISLPNEKSSMVSSIEDRFVDAEETSKVEAIEKYDAIPVENRDQCEYLDALEEQARALEQERNEELAKQSQVLPVSEPEEYWDEDEDDEYYEADGYTTARSLRSRGDNTTGGVTMVLAPRVTARSQRELEAAKKYVESIKTVEDIEDEQWDTSMVAEYGEEIFEYMRTLEVNSAPILCALVRY